MPEPVNKSAKSNAQSIYSFSLVLDGASELTAEIADALNEAGCEDALVVSRDGVLFADFDRGASSLAEAVCSAIRQVESAGTGLTVARVELDELVSAAENADRVGLSKAALVVQDAKSNQKLLDLGERLETIAAVNEGLASLKRGEGKSLDKTLDAIQKRLRAMAHHELSLRVTHG